MQVPWIVILFCTTIVVHLAGASVSPPPGNVLFLHSVLADSHTIRMRRLVRELSSDGHQVTIVRPIIRKIPLLRMTNVTELIVTTHDQLVTNSTNHTAATDSDDTDLFSIVHNYALKHGLRDNVISRYIGISPLVIQLTLQHCRELLSDVPLMDTLRQQQFDVAIVDLFLGECNLALAHHLGVPVIGYWAILPSALEVEFTAAFNPFSYRPHTLTRYTNQMTFTERCRNVLFAAIGYLSIQVYFVLNQQVIQQHLPAAPAPAQLLANISGLLINASPAIEFPLQLPPTFLLIGGFHLSEPKPLPENIAEFISSAPAGVIVLSLGSNFGSGTAPNDTLLNFIRAFARIPQKVVMGFRSSLQASAVPDNVLALDWLPQQDLLAHPSTVLFITHCGMQGVLEALHYAKPMLGLPLMYDQHDALVRMLHAGVAMELPELPSEHQILASIEEITANNSYRMNAERVSLAMRHQASHPLQLAVWLVNHVILTGGANHLKMPVMSNIIQYLAIDVLLCLTVIVLLAALIVLLAARGLSGWLKKRKIVKVKVQ